jgi:hypothetical protein
MPRIFLTPIRTRRARARTHEGFRLAASRDDQIVFGLNATPDKTRHSVTVRRGQDSGPDVIHIQTNGVYQGVVDEVVESRGRITI